MCYGKNNNEMSSFCPRKTSHWSVNVLKIFLVSQGIIGIKSLDSFESVSVYQRWVNTVHLTW